MLIILGGEGQFAHRLRADGLPGDRVGGFNAGYLRGNFHLLRNRAGLERNGHTGGFRHTQFDAFGFGLAEAGFVHDHIIGSGRQQCGYELTINIGGKLAYNGTRAGIDDLNFSGTDGSAGGVQDRACNGAGGAALRIGTSRKHQRYKQQQRHSKFMD